MFSTAAEAPDVDDFEAELLSFYADLVPYCLYFFVLLVATLALLRLTTNNRLTYSPSSRVCLEEPSADSPKSTTHVDKTYGDLRKRLGIIEKELASAYSHTGDQADYILTAPALFDTNVPTTADFFTAYEQARRALAGQTNSLTASDEDAKAIETAYTAWYAAVEFAERMVGSGMTSKDKQRAQRLLNRALHPGSAEEGETACAKLAAILSEITYRDNAGVAQKLDGQRVVTYSPGDDLPALVSMCRRAIEA